MSTGNPAVSKELGELRVRAIAAETALAEANALIADLNVQLSAANAAAVRMAQRAVHAARRMAA